MIYICLRQTWLFTKKELIIQMLKSLFNLPSRMKNTSGNLNPFNALKNLSQYTSPHFLIFSNSLLTLHFTLLC